MPITIITTQTFVTDDGTAYSDTVQETVDQDADATAPIRYQCPVGTVREMILEFGVQEEFGTADAAGVNTVLIINRDDSNAAQIFVSNTAGDEYTFIIGPDEWHYLPVCQSQLAAAGLSDLAQIDALFANASGTIELLVYQNPGS